MRLLINLILIISLAYPVLGFSAPGQMFIIQKDEKSTIDGFVMDSEREKYFRETNEKWKLAAEKEVYLMQVNTIQETEIKYYKDNYMETRKELDKAESKAAWLFPLGFIAGIGLTMGLGYLIILAIP